MREAVRSIDRKAGTGKQWPRSPRIEVRARRLAGTLFASSLQQEREDVVCFPPAEN